MRNTVCLTSLLFVLVLAGDPQTLLAAPPGILRMFGKDPSVASPVGTRQLSEVDGPWMILAKVFAGPEGKRQAEMLADEINKDYGLAVFIHEEDFDFRGDAKLTSTDGRKARYMTQAQYQAYAVLVGEYDAVDHPQLVKDLKRLKSATPKSLNAQGAVASKDDNPLTAVQRLQQSLLRRTGKTESGPLGNAFATTNPMLPEEFLTAPEVDSFVMELNSQVENCLLNNPARYTVVVRTFSGLGTIVDGQKDKDFEPSSKRLNNCAIDADQMTRALRKKGVEAYQFHDRTRSIVAIGSFESLGRPLPGGGFEYDPAIRRIMQTYCAGNDSRSTQFGPGIAANHVDLIPFDVSPTPIAVPKKSKRSLYMGKLGMR